MKLITDHNPDFINFTAYKVDGKGRYMNVKRTTNNTIIYHIIYFGPAFVTDKTKPRMNYGIVTAETADEIDFTKITKKEYEKAIAT